MSPAAASAVAAWCTPADVSGISETYADLKPDTLERTCQWASDMLYDLTGRQWPGERERTIRPRSSTGCPSPIGAPMGGLMVSGGYSCGCSQSELRLPGADPVNSVTSVTLDGTVLDESEYVVVDGHFLLRTADDNGAPRYFPCWQRLDLPTTADGTFEVVWKSGSPPPAGGAAVAALLAGELGLAIEQSTDKCRLPRRTQQIARQGVTVVVYPKELIAKGRTGIAEIDLWLASVNPRGTRRAAVIVSPTSRYRSHHRT